MYMHNLSLINNIFILIIIMDQLEKVAPDTLSFDNNNYLISDPMISLSTSFLPDYFDMENEIITMLSYDKEEIQEVRNMLEIINESIQITFNVSSEKINVESREILTILSHQHTKICDCFNRKQINPRKVSMAGRVLGNITQNSTREYSSNQVSSCKVNK